MKRKGWGDQMRGNLSIDVVHVHPGDRRKRRDRMIRWAVLKQLIKFTYALQTDEDEGKG